MKTKAEIFNKAVLIVCDACEMNLQQIASSQRERSIDAKFILIKLLSERFNDDEIALYLGMTRQGVNYLRNQSERQRKSSVTRLLQECRKQFAKIFNE